MASWQKIKNVLHKLFSGEEVVSSIISKNDWEDQYRKGSWDRLITSDQPNTVHIAEYCLSLSKKLNRPISIVDLGCGNGGLGTALANLNVPVASSLGVDISEEALEKAKKIFPQGEYRCVDLSKEIPGEAMEADVVICNEVIYYIPMAPFLARLKKSTPSVVVFSYYKSWRSSFIWAYIRLCFGRIKRYCVSTAKQKWTIVIYEQK
tara:strand:+ start:3340 stop:3957 length:618 start_codon:yes stop_codon:yes gene_type:complete